MGFYFRKSINVGGLRFNLSKSGIGVSTGFRGFRIGTGPRGNYVNIGAGGVYYRKTWSGKGSPPSSGSRVPQPQQSSRNPGMSQSGPIITLDSSAAASMVASNSTELLSEINEKRRLMSIFPIVVIGSVLLYGVSWVYWNSLPLLILEVVAFAVACFYAWQFDLMRKSVVLMYDLDPAAQRAYEELLTAAKTLGNCASAWNVDQARHVQDRKYHAGAGTLVRRTEIQVSIGPPPVLKTNIDVAVVPAGNQTLYFLPDRLLVMDPSGVGAVDYQSLAFHIDYTDFVESNGAPRDAQIVETTWEYVNKSGGPDRRFANNRQLPVCRYEVMQLSSQSGLNEWFHFSRQNICHNLERAVRNIAGLFANHGRTSNRPLRRP